jgi:hypothetical protein
LNNFSPNAITKPNLKRGSVEPISRNLTKPIGFAGTLGSTVDYKTLMTGGPNINNLMTSAKEILNSTLPADKKLLP